MRRFPLRPRSLLILVLGVGGVQASPWPEPAAPDATGAGAIGGGAFHTCARVLDGSARCWGRNAEGQLGDGSGLQQPTAVAVSGLNTVEEVAIGLYHSCARLVDGSAACWGANSAGQLGDASWAMRPTPVAVSALGTIVELAAGHYHSCARLNDGTVRC
ncbi:MAG: hypothetical protein IPH76_15305 [Xanthomonadales bacterium]|nr:hypothetical protein [Xanthomonadales bacterium]